MTRRPTTAPGRPTAGALLLSLALALPATPAFVRAQVPGGPPGPPARTGPIRATVDVTRPGPPINALMYGYFIENLSSMFEGGLWAEMLGDRKFFHAVNNDSVLTPRNSRSRFVGRWWPLPATTTVAMDSARAWVGRHSPRIALEAGGARGIQQPGLQLTEGAAYTGRVVLAGEAGGSARVQVSLVWGPGAADRQTVTFTLRSAEYRTFSLGFTAGGSTRDGRLEIAGTGTGAFRIGAASLMRADNVEGFRADLIATLKRVNPTTLRWGGNFSSGYEWRDGIGDRDKRPPRYDYAWNAVEQNDVGTFEVLALNRLLGAEPNIGINSGFGDAHSAAQWVEYVNGGRDTPMGRLRAAHGHPEPFGVKWWGIGNEMYGQWQLGHMEIGDYVLKHNRIAEAMRAVDPSIILVASGATPYETGTTARHHRKPLPGDRPYAYDSPEDWSGRLLRHSWQYFDYLAEHIYAVPDQAFDAGLQEFWPVQDPLQNRLRRVANRVKGATEAWQEYNRRMPYLKDTKIRMVMDEWSSGGGGTMEMAGALTTALALHEMFRYSDVWIMSAYTGLTSTVAYDRTDAAPALRPTGLLFHLYTSHFGTLPVPVSGDSPQPELRGTVGVDKPLVSSGSPTYPLDVMATLSGDRQTLTVAVANPSETEQTLRLSVQGASLAPGGRMWTLAVADPAARTVPGAGSAAKITPAEVSDNSAPVVIAPTTIVLYEFKLQ